MIVQSWHRLSIFLLKFSFSAEKEGVAFFSSYGMGNLRQLIHFFLLTAIEAIDIPRILSQQGGETVYPLPRIRALEVHPKLNLAALLFAVETVT